MDYLKIDGSFIRQLTGDVVDQHMVKAMVELATALGKQTIAEFVGDSATEDLLRELGVDFAQGFGIGEPCLIEEIWPEIAAGMTEAAAGLGTGRAKSSEKPTAQDFTRRRPATTPKKSLTAAKFESFMTRLECPRCGAAYDPDRVVNLCACGAPLLVRYDLQQAARSLSRGALAGRPASMWRFGEVLPVRNPENIVSLGEGMTPLLPLQRLGAALGFRDLWIKDEGTNPTGTFKARGASAGISRALELGIKAVAMPTNGNAGGAWAAYGARAGIGVALVMPTDAPAMSVLEVTAFGAESYMVRGQITDAGAIIARSAKAHGWFEAATLKEPYRIEGKKTMGYEIAEEFGWEVPDAILYPTGGGVGIIGIYKALREMQEMGWIGAKLPKLIAVQAAGCAPIVRAFEEGKDVSEPWPDASTVAQGIRVPKALGDFLVLQAVRETGGTCVAVADHEVLEGLRDISRLEGTFICPEGASLVGAAKRLLANGFLRADDRVVLLNTGAGIKYPDILRPELPVVEKDAVI